MNSRGIKRDISERALEDIAEKCIQVAFDLYSSRIEQTWSLNETGNHVSNNEHLAAWMQVQRGMSNIDHPKYEALARTYYKLIPRSYNLAANCRRIQNKIDLPDESSNSELGMFYQKAINYYDHELDTLDQELDELCLKYEHERAENFELPGMLGKALGHFEPKRIEGTR